MSIFEYNEEEEMRKLREGEQEIGEKRGEIKGLAQGRIQGQTEGLAKSCLFVLENHGTVPEWLKKRIMEETAPDIMEVWMQASVTATSVKDFLEKTGLKEPENK